MLQNYFEIKELEIIYGFHVIVLTAITAAFRTAALSLSFIKRSTCKEKTAIFIQFLVLHLIKYGKTLHKVRPI